MPIRFKTNLLKINSSTVLIFPQNVSEKLSSRGLTMVKGTINEFSFQTTLEPDGKKSHWFEVNKTILEAIHSSASESVDLVIEQSRVWSEPKLQTDFKKALKESTNAKTTWDDITPFARWEWIRWIGSTKNSETQIKRIKVACSKLSAGNRRPCCFNSSQCTVTNLSHNGVLLEPN